MKLPRLLIGIIQMELKRFIWADTNKQLNEEETKKICGEIISKLGASSIKDMGKVMGELKKSHSDDIDFAKAGPLIKKLLNFRKGVKSVIYS